MIFYEVDNRAGVSGIYCTPCKDKMLAEFGPGGSRNPGIDELVHEADFTALGREPWADELEVVDQYVQCDGCIGQWGSPEHAATYGTEVA